MPDPDIKNREGTPEWDAFGDTRYGVIRKSLHKVYKCLEVVLQKTSDDREEAEKAQRITALVIEMRRITAYYWAACYPWADLDTGHTDYYRQMRMNLGVGSVQRHGNLIPEHYTLVCWYSMPTVAVWDKARKAYWDKEEEKKVAPTGWGEPLWVQLRDSGKWTAPPITAATVSCDPFWWSCDPHWGASDAQTPAPRKRARRVARRVSPPWRP